MIIFLTSLSPRMYYKTHQIQIINIFQDHHGKWSMYLLLEIYWCILGNDPMGNDALFEKNLLYLQFPFFSEIIAAPEFIYSLIRFEFQNHCRPRLRMLLSSTWSNIGIDWCMCTASLYEIPWITYLRHIFVKLTFLVSKDWFFFCGLRRAIIATNTVLLKKYTLCILSDLLFMRPSRKI